VIPKPDLRRSRRPKQKPQLKPAGPIAPALGAVVLGAIIRSGSHSPGSGVTWTVGLSIMLAGTAALAAVLLQRMTGLRRATERRRAEEPTVPGAHTPADQLR
jgi:hypothetical protein